MWYVVRIQMPLPTVSVVFASPSYLSALHKAIECQKSTLYSSKKLTTEIENLRFLHKIVNTQNNVYPCHYYVASKELK